MGWRIIGVSRAFVWRCWAAKGVCSMKRWLAILVAVMGSLVLVAAVLGSGMGEEGVAVGLMPPSSESFVVFEIADHKGGGIKAMAQQGEYLYIIINNRLEIISVQDFERQSLRVPPLEPSSRMILQAVHQRI